MASNKADPPVHDHVFPVVPEIELPAIAPFAVGAECRHPDATLAPFFDHGWLHGGAPHAVKKKTDLDSVRRAGRQSVQEAKPEAVLPHDVELHKNTPLRLGQFGQNRIERGLAIDQQIEPVSAKKLLACHRGEIPDPGRQDLRAWHLKAPHFPAHFVNLCLMLDQGLLHHLRVGIESAAPKKPVERQSQPGKGDQPDHPGDGSLRGPDREQGVHRAGHREDLHREENDGKNPRHKAEDSRVYIWLLTTAQFLRGTAVRR